MACILSSLLRAKQWQLHVFFAYQLQAVLAFQRCDLRNIVALEDTRCSY